ncbi:MAG: GNAT family N-acetyltransferase [Chlamydiia bacterium]
MAQEIDIFHLLEESFPGVTATLRRCAELGFPEEYRPFILEDRGKLVSHVGYHEYPIWTYGRRRAFGALTAICTEAHHRGQGLATALIQQAMAWAQDRGVEGVVLFSEIPQFYTRASFRVIQEYRFRLPFRSTGGSRQLSPLVSPRDDELFARCIRNRSPLSEVVWVEDFGQMACFSALFGSDPAYKLLAYSPHLDVILSLKMEGRSLHLLDIIGARIPSLQEILDHIPTEVEEIFFYFPPDKLTRDALPEPHLIDGNHLMVRGAWPSTEPFMVPLLSRT